MALGFLVTRPGSDGIDLVEKLKANLLTAFHLPMYNLVNIKHSFPLTIAPEEELFFFSKRAVISTLENWPYLFKSGMSNRCWAIGPATGKLLQENGATNVIVTRRSSYDSYSMVAELEKEIDNIKHRCILFQQENGLHIVSNYLKKQNIVIEKINVYKQELIPYGRDIWGKLASYHAIIFTSGASIEEFARDNNNISGKIAFVVGPRLFNIASSLNIFNKVVELPSANNLEILEAIKKYKDICYEQ